MRTSELVAEQLRQTALETFETLTFIAADDAPTATQSAAPPVARVLVGFHGRVEGHLVITVHGSALRTMAENMLCVSQPTLRLQYDALGEVANVMCGNVVPCIAGRDVVIRLGPPNVGAADLPLPRGTLAGAVTLGLEDGRADLAVYMESP